MSTSLLVTKMEEAAKAKDLEASIKALAYGASKDFIKKADIILLGPQVRFLLEEVKAAAGNTPVQVIDMVAYGTMNGEQVIKTAFEVMEGS